MSKNFVQPADTVELTAPTGGVVSGTAYLIGTMLVVALVTAAQTEKFIGARTGRWTLPKATGQTWTEGASLYWDNTNKNFTTTATSNYFAGNAALAAASGDTTGDVVLNGIGIKAAG